MKPHETRIALYAFMPYGAPELLESQRTHMSRALLAGTLLVTATALALGFAVSHLGARGGSDVVAEVVDLRDYVLKPPPSMENVELPHAEVTPPRATARGGDVVAVPDERADPEVTLPSQPELRNATPGETNAPGGPVVASPPEPEVPPTPDTFIPVDELPVAVQRVSPVYPEMARDAAVEGTVLVQALVGRDGRVMEVRIQPGHSVPLLDEPALAAVKRWVFTPALQNGHPVMVWVRVPMVFKLH